MKNVSTNNPIFYNDSVWMSTLPRTILPFKEESLYGYFLRLDYINNFTPGTVMDMVKTHSTGRISLNRPGLFCCGTIFDIEKFSRLTSVPLKTILSLTFASSLKRLFRQKNIYPNLIGYSNYFKICPMCIEEQKLPLIHMFKNIDICIEHNTLLQYQCSCGKRSVKQCLTF